VGRLAAERAKDAVVHGAPGDLDARSLSGARACVNGRGRHTVQVGNRDGALMPLEEQIPDTLVRRAQRGDSVALTRLLEQVRPRLFRWALVHTSSPDDADDIVQEALLRASRHLGDYSFSARFTTWLHTIVRRTAA